MNVVPQMMAIWLLLIVLSVPALMLLGNPDAMRHPRLAMLELFGTARDLRQDRERAEREAVESVRYAEEVQVAAARAHESSQRWQGLWRQAEEHVNEAWQAWQEAEQRLTRARTASVFASPEAPRTASEYADRERFLHRALLTAVDRGDLPASAWRSTWDPRLHPVEQELALLTATNSHRQNVYLRAAAAERAAWRDAQSAFTAQDSLRHEAATATVQAEALRKNLPTRARTHTPARRALVHQIA